MINKKHLLAIDFFLRITGIACFTLFIAAIYKITGKSSEIGFISLATVGPALVLTVFSGKYTAKLSPLGTLKIVTVLRLLLFSLAALLARDASSLLIAAAVQSLLHQASIGAKMSLDAEFLSADERRGYNSKKTMLANIAMVSGPALGGALIGYLGVALALAGMTAVTLVSSALVFTLKTETLKVRGTKREAGPSALTSLAHLWNNRHTAAIVIVFCLVAIILEVQAPILFPFIKEVYARNSSFTGMLLGLAGLGGIAGSYLAQRYPKHLSEKFIPWLVVADGTIFFIFTQLTHAVPASILFTTLGAMGAITLVVVETAIQRDIDSAHRPFIFSLMQFSGGAGGATVGILAAFLAEGYGAKPVLASAAAVEVLIGLLLLAAALLLSSRAKGEGSNEG